MSALTAAVRDAGRFDRAAVSPSGGLLAAVPVAGVFAVCVAIGQPVAAVLTAVGAMLVGIAWRASGGRPPLAVMATDALLMAVSTFVGSLTGSVLWLHVVVLVVWSFAGGLLVALGRRPGIVGFQMILAVVAFGRFDHPVGPALGLAGLVAAGGAVQVAVQSLIRWPTPLAAQRRSTAAAYRSLAELAGAPLRTTGLPAAAALDAAGADLASFSLLGSPAVSVMRNLVTAGYRLRIELTALDGLAARLPGDGPAARALHEIALDVRATLRTAADAIERGTPADGELAASATRTSEALETLRHGSEPSEVTDAQWTALTLRLAALAGQLRAVASLAPDAGREAGLRNRRLLRPTDRPVSRLGSDLVGLAANLSLASPATRHALRLAIVVPLAALLAHEVGAPRGYWVVIAAAAVLRPEFGATFTRGVERAGGTAVGAAIAGVIAATLHPSEAVTIAIVGVLAWSAFATFSASYATGFAFLTALVVFLINTASPETLSTATDRMLDTLIGGAFGLLVFAAWPTWARRPAQDSLAGLVLALRRYVLAVLDATCSGEPLGDVRGLSRAGRLARTQAEADVMRSLQEPPSRRIDPRIGPGVLSELRRVVQAIHALRLDAEETEGRTALPALEPFTRRLGVALAAVARALESDDLALSGEQVDLRGALDRFRREVGEAMPVTLGPALDDLVDAVNATAELVARG